MRRVALSLISCVALLGCTPKTERFESVCQIVHKEVVEASDKGEPAIVDYELEWDPCPGEQLQIVRGNADFAKCMAKYAQGDLVPVKVEHQWDTRGFYEWDVYQVGDCTRAMDDAEGSFEKSQECSDEMAYGQSIGFNCSRRPQKKLVQVCPWTARN